MTFFSRCLDKIYFTRWFNSREAESCDTTLAMTIEMNNKLEQNIDVILHLYFLIIDKLSKCSNTKLRCRRSVKCRKKVPFGAHCVFVCLR